MSVTTTTDEAIREAKEKLVSTYKSLVYFLDEDTWGHNDYNKDILKKYQI
jgi:hypothetical protein